MREKILQAIRKFQITHVLFYIGFRKYTAFYQIF